MLENIRSPRSNFCKGPQIGTYCTVDNLSSLVSMQVRNTSGALIRTYPFSPSSVLETGPYRYDATTVYIPGSTMAIKSLIVDIADSWRTSGHMGIRSIEFYDEDDQLIPRTTSDFSAYATTFYSTYYQPYMAFDTTRSKTGTWTSNTWICQNGLVTDQRLICVFNDITNVKKIVINNTHRYGGYLNYGVKNLKMYYSNNSITNTEFGADVGSLISIFDGQIAQHKPVNSTDDYELPLEGEVIEGHNEFIGIRYVGPQDQSSFYNGATFYTLERIGTGTRPFYTYERDPEVIGNYKIVNDTLVTSNETEYNGNIIRRWVINSTNFKLDLESSYHITSDSVNWFNGSAFAIENIKAELDWHLPIGTGTLQLATTSGIAKYDKVLIGPSSDVTNIGAVEEVYVHSIVDAYNIEIKTYNGYTPTKYEYIEGDPVTIFKDIKLFSNARPLINAENIRYGFDSPMGTLYSLSHNDYGAVTSVDYNGMYSDVTVATWNNTFNTLSFVKGINLLHLDINYFNIIKSQVLTLIDDDKVDYIPIYGIEIQGTDIYRLQKSLLQRNDAGTLTLEEWDTWNYTIDSLEPYTMSATIVMGHSILGYQESSIITAIVRDQFGVGLLGKNILFTNEGDTEAHFLPEDGQTTTDSDGICSIQYIAGALFKENTTVVIRADGGNPVQGSAYITCINFIPTFPNYIMEHALVAFDQEYFGYVNLVDEVSEFTKESNILCYVRSSFPGGEWVWSGYWPVPDILNPTIEDRNDATRADDGALITVVYQPFFSQLEAGYDHQAGEYVLNGGELPNTVIIQPSPEHTTNITNVEEVKDERFISQNYLSRHLSSGHIVSSTINQYVFIQEARPAFWSEKNPTSIIYWIRLRPFSASLDPLTLKIRVYEKSYSGVTDTVDIAPLGEISSFDAGGGLEGIECTYTFPYNFHHNAVVYVEVEVYDQAAIPNLLLINYWFKIVVDYRVPYFINQFPTIEEANATINTAVTFDVLDIGSGVDINTLEVYINNQRTEFIFTEYTYGQYHISCTLRNSFYYGQQVNMSVLVRDRSDNANLVRDGWTFYCSTSEGPWFDLDEVSPGKCLEGVDRNTDDISLQVYGINDTGIDYNSLKLEVGGKYRNIKVTPIIYRLK